jgi:diguanylate cyclase (GGDEF)-like protein
MKDNLHGCDYPNKAQYTGHLKNGDKTTVETAFDDAQYLNSAQALVFQSVNQLGSLTYKKGDVYRQRITQLIAFLAVVISLTYASMLWLVYDSIVGGLFDLSFACIHLGAFYYIQHGRYIESAYWTIIWGGLQIAAGIILLVGPATGFQLFFLVQTVFVFLLFTERSLLERAAITLYGFVLLCLSETVSNDMFRVELSALTVKSIYLANLVTIFVTLFLAIKFFTDETKKSYTEQGKLVLQDKMTGLANRRFVEEYAGKLFSQCSRYGRPLSLIILEIDQFKSFARLKQSNLADHAVKCVAKSMNLFLRDADIPARYGCGEFLILFPETTIDSANEIAERLRQEIQAITLSLEGEEINITASIGISCCENNEMSIIDELIASADDALYEAKIRGENQVCRAFWPESLSA